MAVLKPSRSRIQLYQTSIQLAADQHGDSILTGLVSVVDGK